jgi:uncharacterized protein
MQSSSHIEAEPLDAGEFGAWLLQALAMLRGTGESEVPCGDCDGCCVSSYPVPIRSHEHGSLAAIPVQHLLTTTQGRTMIAPLANGRCPMLTGTRCSIYAARPLTCRDYDCRIFAAAGISAGNDERSLINRRVRQWRFRYNSSIERATHAAVRDAAHFIMHKPQAFPGRPPTIPTGIAVLAIKVHRVFLNPELTSLDDDHIAREIIAESRRFDGGSDG